MIGIQPTIIPSGYLGFGAQTLRSANPLLEASDGWQSFGICNPMPIRRTHLAEAEAYEIFAERFRVGLSRPVRVVTGEQMDAYAEGVVKIAAHLLIDRPDVILVPVRGGLKPANQLHAVLANEAIPFLQVPSQGLATGNRRDEAVLSFMRSAQLGGYQRGERLRIAVLDTSSSGMGAAKYHRLLTQLAAREGFNIDLSFRLLHEAGHRPDVGLIHDAGALAPNVALVEVESLIVEDFDAALGAEVDFEGDLLVIKARAVAGAIVCRRSDGSTIVVEDENLSHAFDSILANRVSDAIVTLPDIELLEEAWREYGSH